MALKLPMQCVPYPSGEGRLEAKLSVQKYRRQNSGNQTALNMVHREVLDKLLCQGRL
jgi:hypothetical protein